jgi:hypothetical protein
MVDFFFACLGSFLMCSFGVEIKIPRCYFGCCNYLGPRVTGTTNYLQSYINKESWGKSCPESRKASASGQLQVLVLTGSYNIISRPRHCKLLLFLRSASCCVRIFARRARTHEPMTSAHDDGSSSTHKTIGSLETSSIYLLE